MQKMFVFQCTSETHCKRWSCKRKQSSTAGGRAGNSPGPNTIYQHYLRSPTPGEGVKTISHKTYQRFKAELKDTREVGSLKKLHSNIRTYRACLRPRLDHYNRNTPSPSIPI